MKDYISDRPAEEAEEEAAEEYWETY
jgi:hypothetical protein